MNQEKAIELALQGNNIFLTGNAGTGKTYTLNKIIETLQDQGKIVAVTASTGIASTHLNGSTIHSWAGIGIKDKLSSDDLFKLKNNRFSRKKFENTDVLIIDEISMLHDFRLDLVEEVCRFVKNIKKLWGGLQIIISGDFFQLPPVNQNNHQKNYCFNAAVWKDSKFKVCYLDKIYRQDDQIFIDILNNIRKNSVTSQQKEILNDLSSNTEYYEYGINLYPTNNNVDIENAMQLAKIKEPVHISKMTSEGLDWKVKQLKKNCLALETLILKKHSKVIIIVNDTGKDVIWRQYVNGTLGEIIEIKEDEGIISVQIFKTGKIINLQRHTWELKEYNENMGKDVVIASITQFPLKLAWALTIHKSQGATFDFVNLDLTNTFVENMGYVALSRITSLEGLYLKGYNDISLHIDDTIIYKDKEFQEQSRNNE